MIRVKVFLVGTEIRPLLAGALDPSRADFGPLGQSFPDRQTAAVEVFPIAELEPIFPHQNHPHLRLTVHESAWEKKVRYGGCWLARTPQGTFFPKSSPLMTGVLEMKVH
jgi:hypothetical protein